MTITITNTWHILRIDVKDGKARITLSLTEYDVEDTYGSNTTKSTAVVAQEYPINETGKWKNVYGQAFAESYKRAVVTMDALEKTLKEGTTFKNADKDW